MLLIRGEEVDDAVDGLHGVGGVQRGEHQVPGLTGGQRGPHCLGVSHLTDEDHVRVLPNHGAHGRGVTVGVHADLPLVHGGLAVGVEHLDRLLDGHDVDRASVVDLIDHAGERGGLPGAGRSGDQDQPAGGVGQLAHHRGKAEVLVGLTAHADPAEDQADRATLVEHVCPEAPDPGHGQGEVRLLLLVQPAAAIRRHDLLGQELGVLRRQAVSLQPAEMAVHPDDGRRADLQMQVGSVVLGERA